MSNSTTASLGQTLPRLLTEQCLIHPDATAVTGIGFSYTYIQFAGAVDTMAFKLIGSGVQTGSRVGICLHLSYDMVLGIFGILRTGGCYVPADPSFPDARIHSLFTDAGLTHVVCTPDLVERITALGFIAVTTQIESIPLPINISFPEIRPSDTAYILFTSGSTGIPKGVEIKHSSVVNLVEYIQDRYPIGPGDRVLLKSPYTFDGSVWELFGWLIPGATLFVAPVNAAKDPAQLATLIAQHHLNFIFFVPSMLHAFLDYVKAGNHQHLLTSLKWISVGGEVLPVPLVQIFYELLDGQHTKLFNVYGPTETTVYATTFLCQPGIHYDKIPIGETVTNDYIYILDDQLLPVDPGTEGEIFIGGAGVGKGYLNRPELNTERFIPDPFTGHGLMYRTGDLGRQIGPDLYDFIGRRDFQVKLRGLRIEMGEVEHALLRVPGIRACTVVFSKDRKGSDSLVAYLVMEQPITDNHWMLAPEALKQSVSDLLAKELPVYMIPSEMVLALDFPLSDHGKVDRKKLPSVTELSTTVTVDNEYHPIDEVSQRLYDIWREMLERKAIGATENFFAAGGHSLKVLQVITAVMREFGVEIPVGEFYKEMTLPVMESIIRDAASTNLSASDFPAIDVSRTRWPLNAAMQELWFVNSLDDSGITRNILIEFLIRGNPNVPRLKSTLLKVISTELLFRSVFILDEELPVQQIMEDVVFDFEFTNLSHLSNDEISKQYQAIVRTHGRRRFNTERLPLLAFHIVQRNDDDFRLLMCIHHLIFDGWSLEVFVKRFIQAFEGKELLSSFPPSTGLYAEWAIKNLNTTVYHKEIDYWKQKLEGIPELLTLPLKPGADRLAPRTDGDRHWWNLSCELTTAIRQTASTLGVTPFAVLTTGFQLVLAAHASQRDIVVGTPFANRNHPLIADAIGLFTNMVSLRLKIDPADNVANLIKQTNKTAGEAFSNASVIFNEVVKVILPRIQRGINPLFQASIVMQNWPGTVQKTSDFSITQREIGNFTHKLDLMMNIEESEGEFVCWLEYDTSLFEKSFIETLSIHLSSVYQLIVDNPAIGTAEVIASFTTTAGETYQNINQTSMPLPSEATLLDLIGNIRDEFSEKCAIEAGGKALLYGQLVAKADTLALKIVSAGVTYSQPVAVCLPRSAEMVITLLAVLRAGAAYVPVDPFFPAERINLILEEAAPAVIITTSELSGLFDSISVPKILLDRVSSATALPSVVWPAIHPSSPAYILFTSGSTGRPKGIVISHRALINFLLSMQREPGLTSSDVLLALTTISFDIAGLEIWLPLISGAKLVIADTETASDPHKLSEAIEESQATIVQATPATWQMLADANWKGKPGLKVLCGGEALKVSLAAFLLPRCKELWNMYGPTETTIWSLIHKVTPANLQNTGSIPIGKPIANTSIYILNEYLQKVSPGYQGELYIGGEGLAIEYYKQPSLTNISFPPDPFIPDSGKRLYKTGDQVKMNHNGDVFFIERNDSQIKIRGFRIEPGDIEAVLHEVHGVEDVVVKAQTLADGRKILVAFVKSTVDNWPGDDQLRKYLRNKLPDYMVPSFFVRLSEFPLTPNGKTDRKALEFDPVESMTPTGEIIENLTDDEQKLLNLWKEVLQLSHLSPDENFFDAGGDSLVAVRLIVKVEKVFGKRLPLATLFQNGTVRSMARLLNSADNCPNNWHSLVPIRPGGIRKPLFLIHAAGLNLLLYNTVANKLHPDQPIYGLQARGLDGSEEPLSSLEEIASHYIREIEQIEPDGPYALAGFCMGGTIAWEMAHQLTAKGRRVAFVGLFETIAYRVPDVKPGIIAEKLRSFSFLSKQILWNMMKLTRIPLSKQTQFIRDKLKRIKRRWLGIPEIAMQEIKTDVVQGILQVINSKVKSANEVALDNYVLKPWAGKVYLFKAREQTFFIEDPRYYGWKDLALGGVEIVPVEGTHNFIFAPPNDAAFAARLQQYLDQCLAQNIKVSDASHLVNHYFEGSIHEEVVRIVIPETVTPQATWWLGRLFSEGDYRTHVTEGQSLAGSTIPFDAVLCSPFSDRLGEVTNLTTARWFVPQWVEVILPLAGIDFAGHYAPFRKTRNAIRQAGYEAVWFDNDQERLRVFYQTMYVPYISARQKNEAILSGYDEFSQILADGGQLLIIYKDNQPLAGAIIDRQQTPLVHSIGVDEVAGVPYLRLEIIRALFYFSALRMQAEGYEQMNLGGCRPFVNDTSLWFKRSLGGNIIPPIIFRGQGLYIGFAGCSSGFLKWWELNPMIALDETQQPIVLAIASANLPTDAKAWYDYASGLRLPGITHLHLYTSIENPPDIADSWLTVHKMDTCI